MILSLLSPRNSRVPNIGFFLACERVNENQTVIFLVSGGILFSLLMRNLAAGAAHKSAAALIDTFDSQAVRGNRDRKSVV